MHDDALSILPKEMIQLRAWLSDWYDQAFAAGYIHPPFILDEVTADRLEGYFKAGLTQPKAQLCSSASCIERKR
ncbi:hypothetical protein [Paraburkholderia atlantica]|uniref:hypothetical protein n=1 Tax=Paraburkholderia atlantica TaxID=2654982 RepID=UPI003F63B003